MREPTTRTDRSAPTGTPTKLICVRGGASRLPGVGDTVTAPASRAERPSRLGWHAGPTLAEAGEGIAKHTAVNA